MIDVAKRNSRVASRGLLAALVLVPLTIVSAHGQQTTTTIDGRYLPPPPQRFEGQINLNAAQSKPTWLVR